MRAPTKRKKLGFEVRLGVQGLGIWWIENRREYVFQRTKLEPHPAENHTQKDPNEHKGFRPCNH